MTGYRNRICGYAPGCHKTQRPSVKPGTLPVPKDRDGVRRGGSCRKVEIILAILDLLRSVIAIVNVVIAPGKVQKHFTITLYR